MLVSRNIRNNWLGTKRAPIGRNYLGVDNRQLALNIMHWLPDC